MARRSNVITAVCVPLLLAITALAQLPPAGEGRRVYLANNCYGCHGTDASGTPFGAPQFRTDKPDAGDVSEAVRQGEEKGMPRFPKLTTTDINNLNAYFQSLGTKVEPTFLEWWVPVPTQ
ncbi:MAG: cytochrome c [Bryobacteraceae bacterium]